MVKSMRGVELDMGKYVAENALVPAVGNAGLNARGDVIGRGGQIIQTREQIAKDYHKNNVKAVKRVAVNDLEAEIMTPAQAVAKIEEANGKKPVRKIKDAD